MTILQIWLSRVFLIGKRFWVVAFVAFVALRIRMWSSGVFCIGQRFLVVAFVAFVALEPPIPRVFSLSTFRRTVFL